jgi:hypothetical protein
MTSIAELGVPRNPLNLLVACSDFQTQILQVKMEHSLNATVWVKMNLGMYSIGDFRLNFISPSSYLMSLLNQRYVVGVGLSPDPVPPDC